MSLAVSTATPPAATDARFDHTHWSVVLAAAEQQTPGAAQALEELCRAYWPPLYAFLRRSGNSPADAQDLVQGFFAHLLSDAAALRAVHPAQGRFRSFLLACLTHYTRNEHRKAGRQMRGGGFFHVPIDPLLAEENYGLLPADEADPAKLAMRAWANTLIMRVTDQLRERFAAEGKAAQFERLKKFLDGRTDRGDYAQAAADLGLTEGAVRVAVHRLRVECRELLRREVARGVSQPADIEGEIRDLFAAFG
jgi:RNA polymerase sigma-70 factor (ECF subfamily)